MAGAWKAQRGFPLVGLLVVIVVLAVLAAVLVPRLLGAGGRSEEAALKSDLHALRKAISLFVAHTSLYPAHLEDLAADNAPALGLDSAGNVKAIDPTDWNGPYIEPVPVDSISGEDFVYYRTPTRGHRVGEVRSSATGNSLEGIPYTDW